MACGGAEGGKIGRGATADQCDEFSEIVGIEEEAIFAGADEEGGAAAVGGEDGAGGGHGFEGGAVAAVGSDDGEIEARELGEGVEQMVDAFDGVEAPDEEEGAG